jgi:hypothetical protein
MRGLARARDTREKRQGELLVVEAAHALPGGRPHMRVLRWEPPTRRTHSGKYWSVQPVMGSEAARSPSAMSGQAACSVTSAGWTWSRSCESTMEKVNTEMNDYIFQSTVYMIHA